MYKYIFTCMMYLVMVPSMSEIMILSSQFQR